MTMGGQHFFGKADAGSTTPAWVLSRGIEMAKTENRKPKTETPELFYIFILAGIIPRFITPQLHSTTPLLGG